MPSFCNFQKTSHTYISLHVFVNLMEAKSFTQLCFLFIDGGRAVDQCVPLSLNHCES